MIQEVSAMLKTLRNHRLQAAEYRSSSSMKHHKRNVVIVRGDIPPEEGNEEYYRAADRVVRKLAEEMGANVVGYDLRSLPGDGIFEYASDSPEFCRALANKLRSLRMYKEVEISTHVVDLENPHSHN
ncbi:MAG: hypothetical protein HYW25_02575 [Candidatus Aenigmarchaeota archaeon]|nr:hypothetical protein [Candidatus Aenigmarchaeota archaeon]